MARFTQDDWDEIATHLAATPGAYGLPERRAGSVVIMSWNIRKFGALADGDGPKKTPGAFGMIETVAARADLLAIQEVQTETESLYALRDRLRASGAPWEILYSDVTGRAPGRAGMAERMAFLYRADRVRRGNLASDLSFDRTSVTDNMNEALRRVVEAEVATAGEAGIMARINAWLAGQTKFAAARLQRFVQFIRTPHIVEFEIEGPGGAYAFYCVNAHLVSGESKREREQEFFALLEWLLIDSKTTVAEAAKTFVILADLNLDFEATIDRRRAAFADYITSINAEKGLTAKVNFPFLDRDIRTNARRTETFDHIAWISTDPRLPRGRHNDLAGTLGPDGFDFGMFDFVQAFADAGPGRKADGTPDYARYEHDLSDHMPIWVRLPIPHRDQRLFTVD